MTERMRAMTMGVVVERRDIDHAWQRHRWRPTSVIPGAGPIDDWRVLDRGEGWTQYHAATLELELHRKETEAYRVNLSNEPPLVYVGLRVEETDPDPAHEVEPFLVTVSPYEAQDYLDSGDDIVEGVPMPEGVIAWVQDFVTRHHVDEPFVKRKRKRHDPEAVAFGQRAARERRGNGYGVDG